MQAIFEVIVGGQNITATLNPILLKMSVSDRAGQSSDSATIEIDDKDGNVIMPEPGAPMTIRLGWEGQGVGTVFEGILDDAPRASGSRAGRTLSITAKGMDTRGKVKQGQRRHFDDITIADALKKTGEFAGVTVSVDQDLGNIKRPYIGLDDESFVAFGERIASEVGGTFKIVGNKAILAKRNGNVSVSGAPLPSVTAAWGVNLHSYDITPSRGRFIDKARAVSWFNSNAARWEIETMETGTEGGETTGVFRFAEADKDAARYQAESDAVESDRRSGGGSVTIEGNLAAQPEGACVIEGCRPGVDGTYRIEDVDHDYSRGGWITRLELAQPKGTAGKDNRR